MIRTQIQLSEEQAGELKEMAARRGVSPAQLIRQGVDRVLTESEQREKRLRALAVLGRFDTGPTGGAARRDQYLDDAYLP